MLLAVAILVVLGALTWWWATPDEAGPGEPYVVQLEPGAPAGEHTPDDGDGASADGASADAAAATSTLQRLTRALATGDGDAASRLTAPGDQSTAALLGALADNVRATGIDRLALRYVDALSPVSAEGGWTAAVETTWRFEGFDRDPATTEVRFGFRRLTGGRVVVASVGGGTDLRTPVWLSGPLEVERTEDLLVLAVDDGGNDADEGGLATYAPVAEAVVPEVASALPEWRPRLVVEVPADAAGLERALDVAEGDYAQIAAVTGAADGAVTARAPVHVFVNPDVFDGLGDDGQEVVLAHEATHVATDAPLSQAPVWLVEGFADFVALRETTLPLSETAGQAAEEVRRRGPPEELPSAAEFDTLGPHLGAVYEASWLICVALAERGGEAALERFYTAVSDGAELETTLERDFDWTEADLVSAWQERLADLPGA